MIRNTGFSSTLSQVTRRREKPVRYRIVVASPQPRCEVRFKGALGQNGELDLIETVTPFEKDFVAWKVVAMFESLERDLPISVSLFSFDETSSQPSMKIGGFTGSHGGIVKNVDPNNSIGAGSIYD